MLDKTRFANIMAGLAEMYKQTLSEFMLDMYYDVLKDYDYEQVERAIKKVMSNYKYSTLPKPADILEYLEGTPDDKALTAWLQAKEAVQKGGYYASVVFKDDVIAYVIQELGGWQPFCCAKIEDLPFIEKRFKDLYRLLAKRPLKNTKLIGFIEATNEAKGMFDKIPEPLQIGYDEETKQIEVKV